MPFKHTTEEFHRLFTEGLTKAIEETALINKQYEALKFGPNARRWEDTHVLIEGLQTYDFENLFFEKKLRPAVLELSKKIFSKGTPLGFYLLQTPMGVDFKMIWMNLNGLTIRVLVAYEIQSNSFVARLDTRPVFDEFELKMADSKS